MQHAHIRRAKIRHHVAAVFLHFAAHANDLKVALLLIGGDEVLIDERADSRVRQGTCPELRGIVSRELFAGEVPGDLHQEHKLAVGLGLLRCLLERRDPIDLRVMPTGLTDLACRDWLRFRANGRGAPAKPGNARNPTRKRSDRQSTAHQRPHEMNRHRLSPVRINAR
ncbi:MAG: hypothetical protein WD875_19295 [Pirellulales bacterium]